jgi:hypothetical protein
MLKIILTLNQYVWKYSNSRPKLQVLGCKALVIKDSSICLVIFLSWVLSYLWDPPGAHSCTRYIKLEWNGFLTSSTIVKKKKKKKMWRGIVEYFFKWSTLPSRYVVAKFRLPIGFHKLMIGWSDRLECFLMCVTEMVISMLGGGGDCWRHRSRVSSVSVYPRRVFRNCSLH